TEIGSRGIEYMAPFKTGRNFKSNTGHFYIDFDPLNTIPVCFFRKCDQPYTSMPFSWKFKPSCVVLRDPKLIKLVTIKDFEYFTDHQFQYDEDLEPLINKSLFNQGQKWKETRANFCHAFTSKNMKNMFKLSTKRADQLVDFLMQCINDKNVKIQDCKIERGRLPVLPS
ncbi:hypothetical protein L9F63_027018, partial [Diploptera punctata]